MSGRQKDLGGADWETPMFAASIKLGYAMPKYLGDWLDAIREWVDRHKRDRVPLVIWKPLHGKDADAVVILRYSDWVQLHGEK